MSVQNTSVDNINEEFMRAQEDETRKFKLASKMFWQIYSLLNYRGDHRDYKEAMLKNLKAGLIEEGIEARHFAVWRKSGRAKEADPRIVQQVGYLLNVR